MKNDKCKICLRTASWLKHDFYNTILNNDLISLKLLSDGKALPGAHVELPTVPITLNQVSTKRSRGQGRALVRTKVFGGIEFAVDMVESNFAS